MQVEELEKEYKNNPLEFYYEHVENCNSIDELIHMVDVMDNITNQTDCSQGSVRCPYTLTILRIMNLFGEDWEKVIYWSKKLNPDLLSKDNYPNGFHLSDKEQWYLLTSTALLNLNYYDEAIELSKKALNDLSYFTEFNYTKFKLIISTAINELFEKGSLTNEEKLDLESKYDVFDYNEYIHPLDLYNNHVKNGCLFNDLLNIGELMLKINRQRDCSVWDGGCVYTLTILKIMENFNENWEEVMNWSEKLNPKLLSSVPFNCGNIHPSKKEKWYDLTSKALFKLGKYEESIKLSKEALSNNVTDEGSIKFKWRIGKSLEKLSKHDESKEYLNEVKEKETIYESDEKDNSENNEILLKFNNLKEICQSNPLKEFNSDYFIGGFKNEFFDVDMIIKEIENHSKNQDLIKIIPIIYLISEQMNVNSNKFPIDELYDSKYESVNGELFIKILTRGLENKFSKMYEVVLFNNHKDEKNGEKIIKSFENKGSIMVMNILILLNMQKIGKKTTKRK